jgi:hypothetical protein
MWPPRQGPVLSKLGMRLGDVEVRGIVVPSRNHRALSDWSWWLTVRDGLTLPPPMIMFRPNR